MVKVHALQANPSLSKRNWSSTKSTKHTNRNTVTIPWYPFCVVIVVLQIGAILFVNKEIAVSSISSSSSSSLSSSSSSINQTNSIVRRRFKRYDQGTSTKIVATLQSRPDSELKKNLKLASLEERIRNQFNVHVKACQWYRRNTQGTMRVVPDDDCDVPNQEFFVHNPLDHDRYICGGHRIVPAKGFLRVNHVDCNRDMTTSRLYNTTARLVHAKQMPPVEIGLAATSLDSQVGNGPTPDISRNQMLTPEDFPCDVPCRKMVPNVLVGDFSIGGTSWVVRYSMESAGYYPEVEIDPAAHHHNFYYATTSFRAEIPLPYFSWDEYNIQAPAVNYDMVIKGASFIAANCRSTNEREDIVEELMEILRVDSLGLCLQNADPPPGSSLNDAKSMKQQYLFHLAFENSNEMDYVTEKLWSTLASGTLPVYMGAPNIWDHAPPNSIIVYDDFGSAQELGAYLNQVANNRTLYDSYHAWRKQPLPPSFHEKYDFTHVHSICRICRWAHARLYGYTFHHPSQSIREPTVARDVCWDTATQLISYPIRELWWQASQVLRAASEDQSTCQVLQDLIIPTTQVGTWTRTVKTSDGVIDITIEGTGEDGMYQLGLAVQGSAYRLSDRHWRVQNAQSRVTLLSSWATNLETETLSKGVVNIPMRGQKKMQLRLIFEDLELFYQDGDRESTYFGDLMVKDFEKPVERFLIFDG